MSPFNLLVGTYTQAFGWVKGTPAEGIYRYQLDTPGGALTRLAVTPGVDNASYLALHPNGQFLYVTNETPNNEGVSAFAIEPQSQALTLLNRQPAFGGAPCHASVEAGGKFLFIANYMGGNIVAYPIHADGSLGAASDNVPQTGYGPDPSRKADSHAHSIWMDSANRFALTCNLGLDKVIVYRPDLEKGKLEPHSEVVLPAGAGPRHLDFHPNGRWVYVIGELGGVMTVCEWDAAAGKLSEIETVSTLPEGYTGRKSCADVHVHPTGKFLYGSNRGHDSIVIYKIDESTGRLSLIGHQSAGGQTPRNFAIHPTGQWMVVANQDSNNLVSFSIDGQSGKLTQRVSAGCPTPVCVKFV